MKDAVGKEITVGCRVVYFHPNTSVVAAGRVTDLDNGDEVCIKVDTMAHRDLDPVGQYSHWITARRSRVAVIPA